MSEEKTAESAAPKEMSAEERKAKKAELMKFYKEELPLLRVQREYEESITAIEIAKMTRLEIMMAKAQMMAPPPKQDEEPKGPVGPEADGEHFVPDQERKLKPQA